MVADPGSLFDYDRYMAFRGNPLKYSDPSGHYSDEALFAHFNCQDWACVERYFQDGGDYAGLWGRLDILRKAEDGDEVKLYALSSGDQYAVASGHFARIDGKIVVQGAEVAFFTGQGLTGGFRLGAANTPEAGFASLTYLNVGGEQAQSGFYSLAGRGSIGFSDRPMDCDHNDCTQRALNAASTGVAVIGAGCAVATAGVCVIATTVVGAGIGVYSTSRAYADYHSGGDTSALDVSVSATSTLAGAVAPPVYGPMISGGQWLWDEFSPY